MKNSTLAKIGITAGVAILGVAFLVTSTLGDAEHYKMVDELMAGDLSQWKDTELKVHGWVVAGTIKKEVVNQRTERTFVLQKGGKRIRIFTSGPVPDTFKDDSETVATGRLVLADTQKAVATSLGVMLEPDAKYVFVARDLQAKCPSKYKGAAANQDLRKTQFK